MVPTCFIEQLPNELLLFIFEWLPYPRHQRNLLSAMLVCTRWNSLIRSSNKLMDKVTLWIGRINSLDERDISPEYDSYLSRSVRHYRKVIMRPHDERSFAVAVLAVRKFGPYLRELTLKADDLKLMPCDRMKGLELGLEEDDRITWEQELDSLDRCLLPVDEYSKHIGPISPVLYKQLCLRQIEEIFFAATYRYCSRLENLTVRCCKKCFANQLARFLRYEENQMEHLIEMVIISGGHVVLAKSPSLRKLQLFYVRTGPPFYKSLGHTFPMLTHLEISCRDAFDDPCLWAVSQHCSQLEELIVSSLVITDNGFRYLHQLQQLTKLRIYLCTASRNREVTLDELEVPTVEDLIIHCYEAKLETFRRMLEMNVNLKQVSITTQMCTYGGDLVDPFPFCRELRAIRPGCNCNATLI